MAFRVVGSGEKFANTPRSGGRGKQIVYIEHSCGLWAVTRSYVAILPSWIIRAIKNSRGSVNWRGLTAIDSFLGERFSW